MIQHTMLPHLVYYVETFFIFTCIKLVGYFNDDCRPKKPSHNVQHETRGLSIHNVFLLGGYSIFLLLVQSFYQTLIVNKTQKHHFNLWD